MEAVTNSTVLIVLAKINRLNLLNIFERIFSVNEVRFEVLAHNTPMKEKVLLEELFKSRIKIEVPVKKQVLELGAGESCAISLCCEKKHAKFLSDDKKARRTAEFLNIDCIGTAGIILENLRQRNITKNEAKEILNQIVLNSYYLSTDLYARIIELIDDC